MGDLHVRRDALSVGARRVAQSPATERISYAETVPRFKTHVSPGSFQGETRENAVPFVKMFKNAHELALRALWTALRPNMHQIVGFFTYNLNFFLG